MNGKRVGLSLNIALGLLAVPAWASVPFDSTGVERRDGETFVLHRVDRGQTLYSILKRYGATFADYKAANPGAPNEVNSSQLLRVPYNRSRAVAAAAEKPASEPTSTASRPVETASADNRPSMAMRQPATSTPPPAQVSTPQPTATPTRRAASATTFPAPSARIAESAHEVQPGETLYSIARRYNLPVADLKRWNDLPDAGTVHTGQVLVLNGEIAPKKPTKTAAEIAREQLKSPEAKPVAKATTLPPVPRPEPAPARPEPPKPEDSETRREPEEETEAETRAARPVVAANPSASAKYRRETGLAEVIDVDEKSGRYLGLHRSAATGSMVTVRNEANGQVVSVKIIGKLPDTGLNDRVIIKLSPGAFSRLSPVDRRFRAEVSYVMQ